jgi:DNA-binding response OmpR family regulator
VARAKLLLVDDDQAVLSALRRVLKLAGFEVEIVSDVFGLPLTVGRFRPDLILLDVNLPASDGGQLAVSLRKLRAAADCKIVFHSGREAPELAAMVERTGANGYILKGIETHALLARIRELLAS